MPIRKEKQKQAVQKSVDFNIQKHIYSVTFKFYDFRNWNFRINNWVIFIMQVHKIRFWNQFTMYKNVDLCNRKEKWTLSKHVENLEKNITIKWRK